MMTAEDILETAGAILYGALAGLALYLAFRWRREHHG